MEMKCYEIPNSIYTHRIELTGRLNVRDICDMLDWIDKHLIEAKFVSPGTYLMRSEKDTILFLLRWS